MIGPELNIPEQAVLHILVLDFDTLACEETSASGFDRKGCRVHTTSHKQVGKMIGLRLAGFDQMIKGRIAEVMDSEIHVSFEFSEAPDYEKRRERRRKVSIPVWVSGRDSEGGLRCRIVDASQSGCRLASKYLQELPQDIKLQIPGLGMPVIGQIVWRSTEFAGVKLLWKFSNGNEFGVKGAKQPGAAEEGEAEVEERQNTSGFGVRRKKRMN